MSEANVGLDRQVSIQTVVCTEYGHCASCGSMTVLWHKKYKFYICSKCDADKTMNEIAHHALTGD